MFSQAKEKLLNRYRTEIRERAILRTKKRLAHERIAESDLTRDELEALVAEEEQKVRAILKDSSLYAIITFLAFGYF